LHGYPSSIYEFANYCGDSDPELRKILKNSLRGAFLASEYPLPLFRQRIENVFNIKTISWYGHTERSLLATENKEKYRYYPLQTYGLAEAIQRGNTNVYSLLGTSYFNFASPLIRYDTDDTVNNIASEDGILESFTINNGRQGQFVLDVNGKQIPLTGLIFGRHHELFNYCTHIQVSQEIKGIATILYVLKKDVSPRLNVKSLFDVKNVLISFNFRQINKPIKTASGKLNLLVKSESK